MPQVDRTVSGPGRGSSSVLLRSRARRDQLLACAVGVALLGIAVAILQPLRGMRDGIVKEREDEATAEKLAATFPRLTLGGFRGLVATVLWVQAENDKNDRKWLELETKYDIIGKLQPYFVSVYVFHSWNEAYNLSAQWFDQDAKYRWVLEGMKYLYTGESFNPGSADLIEEQGHLYFLKLGGAFERIFYRAHWRTDIARFHELNKFHAAKAGKRSDDLDTLELVHEFALKPHFNTEELPDPTGSTTFKGFGISITDKWLFEHRTDPRTPEQPMDFRWGLSPFYFAYVEHTRAVQNGYPSTAAPWISAGWPGMDLRLWCRDDLYYSWDMINRIFNKPENLDDPSRTLKSLLDTPLELGDRVAEMNDCFRNIDLIAPKAQDLLQKNMEKWPQQRSVHVKHVDEAGYLRAAAKAEAALLKALVRWHNDGRKVTEQNKMVLLEAQQAFDPAIAAAMAWVDKMYPQQIGESPNPDRADFEKYAYALRRQREGLERLLTLKPGEEPDLSFLGEEVVER